MSVTLIQGDCLEKMKDIPDKSVDMILTDPPYGMDYKSGRRSNAFEKIKNDNNIEWINIFMNESYRVLKDNSVIYIFCSWHNLDVFKQKIELLFELKNLIVWEKNNHGSGDLTCGYAPKHELIFFAMKGRVLNKNKRISDVLHYPKVDVNNMVHPTQKPINLLNVFINQHSEENNIILDPFMGSGSTGVACKKTNRNFIGIELDEKYFEIAKQRIENTHYQFELELEV